MEGCRCVGIICTRTSVTPDLRPSEEYRTISRHIHETSIAMMRSVMAMGNQQQYRGHCTQDGPGNVDLYVDCGLGIKYGLRTTIVKTVLIGSR